MDRRVFLASSLPIGLAGCLSFGDSSEDEDEEDERDDFPNDPTRSRLHEETSVTQEFSGYSHWSPTHYSEDTDAWFRATVEDGPAVTVE